MSIFEPYNEDLFFSTDCHYPKEYQWYLALGSILSAYNGDYVNDIKNNLHIDWIKQSLETMWGVTDNATFKDTANWLINEGHRTKYLPRLNLIKHYHLEIENANNFFKSIYETIPNIGIVYYQFKNKNTLKQFIKDNDLKPAMLGKLLNIVSYCPELYKEHIADYMAVTNLWAWDAVRLVNLCRWSLNCGYINHDEFMHYVSQIKEPVQNAYDNWQDVAIAYAITAVIWSPSPGRAESFAVPVGKLLKDPHSLLKVVSFK